MLGHEETVFEPHAEFPRNVKARFVRETHAGLQHTGFAAHKVYRLMAIEPDAVPGAVRQAGQAIIRTIAQAFVLAAYCIVDTAGWNSQLGCPEGDLLALANVIPDLALSRAWRAQNERA